MCNFGHLHLHTEYSTLDGMIKVKELMQMVKSHGQSFVAITDHGTTSALWEAQKYGDEYGIKVIHGCEFYYQRENDGENGHLLVLAKNNIGLTNIFKMQRIAYQEHFYKKPRITWETLLKHKEGLIITTTCLASEFNQALINGDVTHAKTWAKRAKEAFGEDFYIELQPNQIPEQFICNKYAIDIAKQLNIQLVATNDVHYGLENDCFPHEVLLALQINKKMSDEKRFRFSTNDFWLKTEEEMYETFDGLPREIVELAITTTKAIADKCDSRISKGNYLPQYYDTGGKAERQLLIEKTVEGARNYGLNKNNSFMKEVQNEIDVIDRNGYAGYFLIVSDYVNTARRNGIIVGDGRGSGAGSKVAYLSGITKIPPHEYDLLFARFMADGRQPDFDVDFSDQDAVFEDLQRKYGSENVARIISFGTLSPKSVIRKVMNAFDHPIGLQNQISKLIPDLCESLQDAYKTSPQLLDYKNRYKTEWEVIERLEGVKSHESTHAGGIIIWPGLAEILPIKTKSDQRDKFIITFDKYMLEEIGHYKFDVLGLETLPIIQRTIDSIKQSTGFQLDLHQIDLNDENVYDMLCTGDVSGVFQINNQAGKVIEQQPRNFRDLIAINALIRPGVGDWNEYIQRRRGKEWFKDPHRPWMHETLGTMTYQEQFLLDANILCGWEIAYADKVIRKGKNLGDNEEVRNQFVGDGQSLGHSGDYMLEVWKQIIDAQGDYSFNKSHSASYAMLSYHTAYLKHYYPTHFYASLMSSEKTDGEGQNEIASLMAEIKTKGIQVKPPSINTSGDSFIVHNDFISYRISTIKHVGDSAVAWILDNRPFNSFNDFLERRTKSVIKQNVLVNLIKAGCFDFDEPNRAELIWRVDIANRSKTEIKNEWCPPYPEYNDTIKSEWELEVLGMYLTSHPMQKYGFKSLQDFKDGSDCLQGGIIYDSKIFKDKNSNEMAFIHINTLFGNVKLLIFSSIWKYDRIKTQCFIGNSVLVEGRRSGNDLIVNSLEALT